jgi:hypothetical protein
LGFVAPDTAAQPEGLAELSASIEFLNSTKFRVFSVLAPPQERSIRKRARLDIENSVSPASFHESNAAVILSFDGSENWARIRIGPQGQVKMIRHDPVDKQAHRNPGASRADQLHKGLVITAFVKYFVLRVTAIDDVVAHAANRGAPRTWHGA